MQRERRGFRPNLSKGCAIGKITFGIAVTEVRDSREKGAGIALAIGTLFSRSNLSGPKSQQKSISTLMLDRQLQRKLFFPTLGDLLLALKKLEAFSAMLRATLGHVRYLAIFRMHP